MKRSLAWLTILGAASALAGCPPFSDGDVGEPDQRSDAGVPASDGAVRTDERARCESVVDAYRNTDPDECTEERLRHYGAARTACATDRAPVVTAVFECLRADSCQTPSDPSAATECVDQLVRQLANDTLRAIGRLSCACRPTDFPCADELDGVSEELLLVTEAEQRAVLACMQANGSCDALDACASESQYLRDATACYAGSEQAACEQVIDDYRAQPEECSEERVCLYDAAREACSTERAPLVREVFGCFSTDACQSPSDPSGATECIDALVRREANDDLRAIGRRFCDCRDPEYPCQDELEGVSPELLLATADEVAAIRACAQTAACDGLVACAAESRYVGRVVACNP